MNYSRRVVVSFERKYVHEVLVNRLFKLTQKKLWLGDRPVMTIAVDWDVKQQNRHIQIPFNPNGISYPFQFRLRVVGCNFHFY